MKTFKYYICLDLAFWLTYNENIKKCHMAEVIGGKNMKYCAICGSELADTATFCNQCGAPCNNPEPQAQPQQNYQQQAQYQQAQQNYQQQAQYQQPQQGQQPINNNVYIYNQAPVGQLKTNRGLLKMILLSLITFGIYPLVLMSSVSNDINIIAGRYDGKRTMHFCLLLFIVAPITLGIGSIVWHHNISGRIGNELARRGISYSFGASSFWLWSVLGALIIIGPLVYLHKLLHSMNLLAENYNVNG